MVLDKQEKKFLLTCSVLMLLLLWLSSAYDLAIGHKHKGQVHIDVWRGASKGHKKDKFAPWGYYAKLPADKGKKKKHHLYG